MASVPGRLICPACGANNFETQAACWKCGKAFGRGDARAMQPTNGVPSSPASSAPFPASFAPSPSVAIWAGIALAVLFPYIAVPVGIVFLMLDDRRKLEIGRTTLIWGVISTILHTLIMSWLVGAMVTTSVQMLYGIAKGRQAAGQSAGMDDLNIPGLPQTQSFPRMPLPGNRNAPVVPQLPQYQDVPLPEVPDSVKRP